MGAGAFGAPWILAINGDGERKAWFGNDRWDHVFEHLHVCRAPCALHARKVSSSGTGEGKVMRGHIVGNRSPFDLWRAFILKSLI